MDPSQGATIEQQKLINRVVDQEKETAAIIDKVDREEFNSMNVPNLKNASHGGIASNVVWCKLTHPQVLTERGESPTPSLQPPCANSVHNEEFKTLEIPSYTNEEMETDLLVDEWIDDLFATVGGTNQEYDWDEVKDVDAVVIPEGIMRLKSKEKVKDIVPRTPIGQMTELEKKRHEDFVELNCLTAKVPAAPKLKSLQEKGLEIRG